MLKCPCTEAGDVYKVKDRTVRRCLGGRIDKRLHRIEQTLSLLH